MPRPFTLVPQSTYHVGEVCTAGVHARRNRPRACFEWRRDMACCQ
jgi:hypothetical protein